LANDGSGKFAAEDGGPVGQRSSRVFADNGPPVWAFTGEDDVLKTVTIGVGINIGPAVFTQAVDEVASAAISGLRRLCLFLFGLGHRDHGWFFVLGFRGLCCRRGFFGGSLRRAFDGGHTAIAGKVGLIPIRATATGA
jgi:hypothetical protein